MNTFKKAIIPALVASAIGATSAMSFADQPMNDKEHMKNQNHYQHEKYEGSEMSKTFDDGWKEGKLETAYLFNTSLNNFAIDTDVVGNKAVLKGTVKSDIDKELAEEIALSIDGITSVDNRLVVDSEHESTIERKADSFASNVKDPSITATVKTKLLANSHTSGMDINVDTDNRVVTLKGKVGSATESDLAEKIAENVDDVEKVVNNLRVEKNMKLSAN